MDRIRAFTQDDIPQVAELYRKTFGGVSFPLAPLEGYFHRVFFENPWSDRTFSSLIYERDQRNVVGFIGVIPRRFHLKGRSLKAAVTTQFMVEEGSRNSLAGLKLLQAIFAGPQDLTFTDGANESSRRIWKALGGMEVPLYSISWTRIFEPSGAHRGKTNGYDLSAAPSEPALMHRQDTRKAVSHYTEQELDIRTLLDHLPSLTRTLVLYPDYDAPFVTWLLSLVKEQKKHGPLGARVLRYAGKVVGWYMYYLNEGGTSQVLQLVASPESFDEVLDHLFQTLREQGSTGASGRIDPRYLHTFSRQGCTLSAASAVLVQASDAAVLEPIYRGDALLSRLEGEWWNCFSEFLTASASENRGSHRRQAKVDHP